MWTKRSKKRKSARDGPFGASYCKEHMREEGERSNDAASSATVTIDELIFDRDVAFS